MNDPLRTRFAERCGLAVPIAAAPMALASGGRLAQAVSDAGAFGFVGGEAVGLVRDLPPAAVLVDRIASEARAVLKRLSGVS